MKAITIIMFVMILNISMSIINAANTIDPLFFETKQPYSELYDDVTKEKLASESYLSNAGVSDTTQLTFGDYFWATFKFAIIIGKGIIAIPWLLNQFGITNFQIKVFISSIIYLVYLLGLYQWISNRASKSMY